MRRSANEVPTHGQRLAIASAGCNAKARPASTRSGGSAEADLACRVAISARQLSSLNQSECLLLQLVNAVSSSP